MKRSVIYSVVAMFVFWSQSASGQNIIDYKVTIARDSFGVPHIFGETDEDVAYGMAWVQCEDQFKTMQEILAACRGVYGEIKGKDGVIADIGIQYMGLKDFVDENYDNDVKGDFKGYLESYVQGVNDYAEKHPERVLLKKLFPISGREVLVGYMLGNVEISGAGNDLKRILNGRVKRSRTEKKTKEKVSSDGINSDKGSNAFAFAPSKTKDGSTYLAINSHQPLEGWYSWYEAHLHSEEGLNIIGGTFAGGASIFLGANEHLGWAHTVNHADFSDVYELTVNEDGTAYLYDGEWLPLTKKKAKAKVKVLGFMKIPIKRAYYESVYGPTFKTDSGYFAWRFMAGQTLKMAEQWWKMNKAQNLEEFREALEIRGIISTNIVYADREGNIYYVSNGRIPERDPAYDWNGVLPGNTSETLTDNNLIPFDSLPQVLNPKSGWVFNTNNTPFTASASGFSPRETKLNGVMSYQESGRENNRSVRFLELMEGRGKLTYEDFKRIKYDDQYPSNLRKVSGVDVNVLFRMDPKSYPEVADALEIIQNWDRRSNVESEGATMFLATAYAMKAIGGRQLQREEMALKGLIDAKSKLLEKYGTLKVALGDFQRHIRGDVNLPMAGAPDVLASIYSVAQEDGTYKAVAGESYIELVRFSKEGVEIESINAYGNSEVDGDPNSTNQMEYFTTQRLKKMTFDKEEILSKAVKVYNLK
ncbi:penicillin acylase family protein [Portibacter lacus]|uniref:Penicillin amidase n=1 Tax=Portibacter lacus TaxID=1099794 RepID=A0AA37WDP7_9BACT|nr:penicillin acylase family protein [Portibacter lacus]GLR18176.1 penicillin amidase [Portibacter lacus]